MNKKNVVTKENIKRVADFLENACDYFKKDGEGCYNFPLSEDFALYVGWSNGYDLDTPDIIKSARDIESRNGHTYCYGVDAGVKVRNDYDCSDFDFLSYPYCIETDDVWDNGISMSPNKTRCDYENDARWFLEVFVAMTNALDKGKLYY